MNILKQDSTFFSCLSELKEELRECLLHRAWKCEKSLLVNESNIVWVELKGRLVIRTGVLTIEACLFSDYDNGAGEFVHFVKSKGTSFSEDILDILGNVFISVFSGCSIQEAYKNFQSNNIEKIIKDKIKCREIETFNISVNTDFQCQYH